MPADQRAARCVRCDAKFTLLRRRTWCPMCDHTLCAACFGTALPWLSHLVPGTLCASCHARAATPAASSSPPKEHPVTTFLSFLQYGKGASPSSLESTDGLFAEQPSPDSAPVCLLSTSSSMEQFSCELLPAQRRLLEDPVHLGVAAIPLLLHIDAAFDTQRFQAAIQQMLGRHPILRSMFSAGCRMMRFTRPQLALSFSAENATALSRETILAKCRAFLREPFQPEQGVMVRTLVMWQPTRSYVALVCSRLALDEWAVLIFLEDVFQAYRAPEPPAREPEVTGADQYLHHQLGRGLRREELRRFWATELLGSPAASLFPPRTARRGAAAEAGAARRCLALPWTIPWALLRDLRAMASREGCSLKCLLLTALQCVLFRYTSQTDALLAFTTPAREKDSPHALGPFSNDLLLRFQPVSNPSFQSLLQLTRSRLTLLKAHQHWSPFLARWLVQEEERQRQQSAVLESSRWSVASEPSSGQLSPLAASPSVGSPLTGIPFCTSPTSALLHPSSSVTNLCGQPSGAVPAEDLPVPNLAAQCHVLLNFLELAPSSDFAPLLLPSREPRRLKLLGLDLEGLPVEEKHTPYAMQFTLAETHQGILGEVVYDAALYDGPFVAGLCAHLTRLLEAAVRDASTPIGSLPLLAEAEQRTLREDFATTPAIQLASFADGIGASVAATARRQPAAVAVEDEHRRLTWAELAAAANRLAHHLEGLGVGPGELVAVLLHPGTRLAVTSLAVVKTGAALCVLQRDLPHSSLRQLLRTSQPRCVVTEEAFPLIRAGDAPVVVWEAAWEAIATHPAQHTDALCSPAALCGLWLVPSAAGPSKGVQLLHGALQHFLAWYTKRLGLTAEDRVGHIPGPMPTTALLDLWPALLSGATLSYAPTDSLAASHRLVNWLRDARITTCLSPPALLGLLLPPPPASAVRQFVVPGAEVGDLAVPAGLACKVWGVYGQPETLWVAMALMPASADITFLCRPAPGVQFYVLDAHRELVPIGVDGELYIGGAQLSPGYTAGPGPGAAVALVAHPFPRRKGEVAFRSGDVARWTRDGLLEFRGRTDRQITVRGFRVPLAEIEVCLRQHPAVQEACVVSRSDAGADSQIVAYVVRRPPAPDKEESRELSVTQLQSSTPRRTSTDSAARLGTTGPGSARTDSSGALRRGRMASRPSQLSLQDIEAAPEPELTAHELRRFLLNLLAPYMIPARFVFLDGLPRKGNTIDFAQLPPPATLAAPSASPWAPPRPPLTATEAIVSELFSAALGVFPLPADADFFELGGHSIAAMKLLCRIQEQLKVPVPFHAFLVRPTIEGLTQLIAGTASSPTSGPSPSQTISPNEHYPLSQTQQWCLAATKACEDAPTLAFVGRVLSDVDPEALGMAFQHLVDHNPTLRMAYTQSGPGYSQRCLQKVTADFKVLDAAHWTAAQLQKHCQRETAAALSLSTGHSVKARLFLLHKRRGGDPPLAGPSPTGPQQGRAVLVVVAHVLALDVTSFELLLGQLGAAYSHFLGKGDPLPVAPEYHYLDFMAYQEEQLQGPDGQDLLQFWAAELSCLTPIDVARLCPHTSGGSAAPAGPRRGDVFVQAVPDSLLAQLQALCKRLAVSLDTVLLAVLHLLLHRYTGHEDVAIGYECPGRRSPRFAWVLGCFVNAMLIRVDVTPTITMEEVLERTHQKLVTALIDDHAPVLPLLAGLRAPATEQRWRPPPCSVLFSAFHPHDPRLADLPGFFLPDCPGCHMQLGTDLSLESTAGSPQHLMADLALRVATLRGSLSLAFQYRPSQLEPSAVRQLARHYVALLEATARQPSSPLREMPLLDVAERHQLAVEYNSAPELQAPGSLQPLPQQLAATAARWPDAVALATAHGEAVTYGELHRQGAAVAAFLRQRGAAADRLVAVALPRGPLVVAACLGAVQAGVPYSVLPLGGSMRQVDQLLGLLQPFLLLTQIALQATLPAAPCAVGLWEDLYFPGEDVLLPPAKTAELLCVTFTSGSTGQPKAVAITVQAVDCLLRWLIPRLGLRAGHIASHAASPAHAGLLLDCWPALAVGATVAVAPEGPPSGALTRRWAAQGRLTHCAVAAALVPGFLGSAAPAVPMLRSLQSSGDQLAVTLKRGLGFTLLNTYGPAECCSCIATIRVPPECRGPVPLGRPMPGSQFFVLDAFRQLVPIGVTGELYVGGDQLSRGYYRNAALTQPAFVPHPFQEGATLYRTGDLVRWLQQGALDYVGRCQPVLRVRGRQLDVPAVEAAVREVPAVQDVAVVLRQDDDTARLVLYVVWARVAGARAVAPIEAAFWAVAPDFPLPTSVVALPAIPYGPDHKLSYAALPDVQGVELTHPQAALVAESNANLSRLHAFVQEVLQRPAVRPTESLFLHGLDSLTGWRLAHRIRDGFGVDLLVATLLANPTLASLADLVEGGQAEATTQAPSPIPLRPTAHAESVMSFASLRSPLPSPMMRSRGTPHLLPSDSVLSLRSLRHSPHSVSPDAGHAFHHPDSSPPTGPAPPPRNFSEGRSLSLNVPAIPHRGSVVSIGGATFVSAQSNVSLAEARAASPETPSPLSNSPVDDPFDLGLCCSISYADTHVAPQRPDDLPLNYSQRSAWLRAQLDPAAAAPHAWAAALPAPCGLDAVAEALQALLMRYPSLRASFEDVDGMPVQRIAPLEELQCDVGWAAAGDSRPLAEQCLRAMVPVGPQPITVELPEPLRPPLLMPFALSAPPLLRLLMFGQKEREVVTHVLLVAHPLLVDGCGLRALLGQLTALLGQGDPVSPLPSESGGAEGDEQAGWRPARSWRHWKRVLAGPLPVLTLPADYAPGPEPCYAADTAAVVLPAALTARLRRLAQHRSATFFAVMATAFQVLLHRYTKQPDLLLGVLCSGRPTAAAAGKVAPLATVLPLRSSSVPDDPFEELLHATQKAIAGVLDNFDCPFSWLLRRLVTHRDPWRFPLTPVLLKYVSPRPAPRPRGGDGADGDDDAAIGSGDEEAVPPDLPLPPTHIMHDLECCIADDGRRVRLALTWRRARWGPASMRRLLQHYTRLLRAACDAPAAPASALPLCEEEPGPHGPLLQPLPLATPGAAAAEAGSSPALAGTAAASRWQSAVARLRAVCATQPDGVAAVRGAETLTFRGLWTLSGDVLRLLRPLRLPAGSVVALLLSNSPLLVAATLAVWRCGAACVTLPPGDARRAEHALRDSGAAAVVAEPAARGVAEAACQAVGGALRLVVAGPPNWAAAALADPGADEADVRPDAVAYLVYGSGRTGPPKAAVFDHRAVAALAGLPPGAAQAEGEAGAAPRLAVAGCLALPTAPLLWWAGLCRGGPVLYPPGDMADLPPAPLSTSPSLTRLISLLTREPASPPAPLPLPVWRGTAACAWLAASRASAVLLTPPELDALLEHRLPLRTLRTVRVVGGAPPAGEALRRLVGGGDRSEGAPVVVENGYGAAEAPVISVARVTAVPGDGLGWAASTGVPIGDAVLGMRCLVLDPDLSPTPPGACGELYVAGPALARGYHRRAVDEAVAFLSHPRLRPGERMYRTGDLVRRTADGTLCLVGRRDRTVSIRGGRIDLGQVEGAALRLPWVRRCHAAVHDAGKGHRSLVLYAQLPPRHPDCPRTLVLPRTDLPDRLRLALAARLPPHMVPAVVVLDALPLCPGGKVDEARLPPPPPPFCSPRSGSALSPDTPEEVAVAKVFCELLNLPKVGAHESFFALGGHSLLASRLVARVAKALGVAVPLGAFFRQPTVHGLALAVCHRGVGPFDGDVEGALDPALLRGLSFLSPSPSICSVTAVQLHHGNSPSQAPPSGSSSHSLLSLSHQTWVAEDSEPLTLCLTGATGCLGRPVLALLLERPAVARVYCLVRAPDIAAAADRLSDALDSQQVPPQHRHKAQPIAGDLSTAFFGLPMSKWDELCTRVNAILHLGAATDWLAPYAALKPVNVVGTQECIRLLGSGGCRKTLWYVTPAGSPADCLNPHSGLLRSKRVAEDLVLQAAACGAAVVVVQLPVLLGGGGPGAAPGPRKGSCPAWVQRVPILGLLRVCLGLQQCPSLPGATVDVLPVATAAAVVASLVCEGRAHVGRHCCFANPDPPLLDEVYDMLRSLNYLLTPEPPEAWADLLPAPLARSLALTLRMCAAPTSPPPPPALHAVLECLPPAQAWPLAALPPPDRPAGLAAVRHCVQHLMDAGHLPRPLPLGWGLPPG